VTLPGPPQRIASRPAGYLVATEEIYTDWEKLVELSQEKEELSKKLEKLYLEWGNSAETKP